jgi:phosphoketolase
LVINRVPKLGSLAAYAKQEMRDKLIEHKRYVTRYGDDMPEVIDLAVGAFKPGIGDSPGPARW